MSNKRPLDDETDDETEIEELSDQQFSNYDEFNVYKTIIQKQYHNNFYDNLSLSKHNEDPYEDQAKIEFLKFVVVCHLFFNLITQYSDTSKDTDLDILSSFQHNRKVDKYMFSKMMISKKTKRTQQVKKDEDEEDADAEVNEIIVALSDNSDDDKGLVSIDYFLNLCSKIILMYSIGHNKMTK